jgi:hypothetical protein
MFYNQDVDQAEQDAIILMTSGTKILGNINGDISSIILCFYSTYV